MGPTWELVKDILRDHEGPVIVGVVFVWGFYERPEKLIDLPEKPSRLESLRFCLGGSSTLSLPVDDSGV